LSKYPSSCPLLEAMVSISLKQQLSRSMIKAVIEDFDYAFAENGLTAYKMGKPLASQSFINHVGEERYKPLVNFILHYIADMDIPIKRSMDRKVSEDHD
jgi:hypothetical protein